MHVLFGFSSILICREFIILQTDFHTWSPKEVVLLSPAQITKLFAAKSERGEVT